MSEPLPSTAIPQRLMWRGADLAADTGKMALPADVEAELDRIVAALDRDPLPLLLLRRRISRSTPRAPSCAR